MLIEASRGGHANVAKLLLRQPRHVPRKSTDNSGEAPSTTGRQPEGRERKGSRKGEPSRSVPAATPKEQVSF